MLNSRRRFLRLALGSASLSLLAAACQPGGAVAPAATPASSGQPTPPATAGGRTRVSLGQVGGLSDAPFFIAMERGYFAEQGIELDASRFTTAAQMVAPLGTGQLDIGGGAPGAGLFNAVARDVAVVIVADKGRLSPGHGYEALIVRSDLLDSGQVKSVADLKGRTIALAAKDIAPEHTLSLHLRMGGLTTDDVQITPLGFPEMVPALANRSIDTASPIEPFLTQVLEQQTGRILDKRNDEIAPNQQTAVVLYSPKFASDKPDLARRFMVAYLRAVRDYNDAFDKKDPAKRAGVVDVLVKTSGVSDRALYDKMVFAGLDPNGRVNTDSLNAMQDYFLARGSQKQRADLNRVVDHQYVDAAVQELGRYPA